MSIALDAESLEIHQLTPMRATFLNVDIVIASG